MFVVLLFYLWNNHSPPPNTTTSFLSNMSKRTSSMDMESKAKRKKGLGPLADPNWIFTGSAPPITNPYGSLWLLYEHMSPNEQTLFKDFIDSEFKKVNSMQDPQRVLAIQVAHKIVNQEILTIPEGTYVYDDIRMLFG